jgi:hypothetical protein
MHTNVTRQPNINTRLMYRNVIHITAEMESKISQRVITVRVNIIPEEKHLALPCKKGMGVVRTCLT